MLETLDQFTQKLTDSGLMSVEQLTAFRDRLPPDQKPQDAVQLSRSLIEYDLLTDFQVDALSSGDPDPLIVGDYVIRERVGAGGMGVVFKAQHRRMKRMVAMKMLSSEFSKNDSAIQRFEREVEVAAKLNHRNVVAALDARAEQGTHYLIMEFVEGRPLSRIVDDDGPLPVARTVDYVIQAATGFAYAHELGVIHRDVKPSNLILGVDDVVKILDMGLARFDSPVTEELGKTRIQLTGAGVIMGTPDYMSPEQALDSSSVDHRVDIYSLGCTLYYLLAGRAIYSGGNPVAKLVAHREQPIPSLRDVRDDVPEALDATFQRMVAKRVEERFQSMSDVIQHLQTCLSRPDETRLRTHVDDVSGTPDGADPGLTQVVDKLTPEEVRADELPVQAANAQPPIAPAISNWKRRPLVLLGKFAGAILGASVGADIGHWLDGGFLGGLAASIGTVFYIWFGWRCGGGYAWMAAHLLRWSHVPPETKAGQLFQIRKLKLHAAAVVVGGIVGVSTGIFWQWIFIVVTALALADRVLSKYGNSHD